MLQLSSLCLCEMRFIRKGNTLAQKNMKIFPFLERFFSNSNAKKKTFEIETFESPLLNQIFTF